MLSADSIVSWSRRGGVWRRKAAQVLCVLLFSFNIPAGVEVGKGVHFMHNCLGTVLHPRTTICDGAMIARNVTFGDGLAYRGVRKERRGVHRGRRGRHGMRGGEGVMQRRVFDHRARLCGGRQCRAYQKHGRKRDLGGYARTVHKDEA